MWDDFLVLDWWYNNFNNNNLISFLLIEEVVVVVYIKVYNIAQKKYIYIKLVVYYV